MLLATSITAVASTDSIRVHADLVRVTGKGEILQELYLLSKLPGAATVDLKCYLLQPSADSMLVYRVNRFPVKLKRGVQTVRISISKSDKAAVHPDFRQILVKAGGLPAGEYLLDLVLNDSFRQFYTYRVDSVFRGFSPIKQSIDRLYKAVGGKDGRNSGSKSNISLIRRSNRKLEKLVRSRGLQIQERQVSGRTYHDIFYREWFVGSYEIDAQSDLLENIKASEQFSFDRFALSDPEQFQSLTSQMKNARESKKEEKEISGVVELSGYAGNGQEEGSQLENNYYEARAQMNIPFDLLPINVDVFYTSQDRQRSVKSSFFRLHYDTKASKEELLDMVESYNNKQDQVGAQGVGLESVYSTFLSRLSQEKTNLSRQLLHEMGKDPAGFLTSPDTAVLRQQLESRIREKAKQKGDSSGTDKDGAAINEQDLRDSVSRSQERVMKRISRLRELEQKISKYESLLAQHKNTRVFDSLLNYEKLKDRDELRKLSYKQLSKRAGNLLPDGKYKQFVTGVTHFDAGIISQQVSSYTLDGQTMKGLDFGYDFGLFQAAVTAGKVEYINRDGVVDEYTGLSGRVRFQPGVDHEVTLIYFSYTPSQSMLGREAFFKNVDVALPGFRSPVHIAGVTYEGNIQDRVSITSEFASSTRQTTSDLHRPAIQDQSAYKISAEGEIPGTPVTLEAGYEHVGRQFENHSLAVQMSGVERYKAGAKGVFFRNFLQAGVDYNYLIQQNFSSEGTSARWGFEVQTRSKRYPNLALSYKPFSSFRTANDTLAVPQRPLLGEVWTGRINYQIKKPGHSIRFMGMYTRNSSSMDTIKYGASTLQLSTIYQESRWNLMVTAGHSRSEGTGVSLLYQQTEFTNVSGSYMLNEQWVLNGGLDLGMARSGITRYGGTGGVGYRFEKIPLMLRASIRQNSYQLSESLQWRHLLAGVLDLSWQFRFSLRNQKQ